MIAENQLAIVGAGAALTQILVKPRTLELLRRVAKKRREEKFEDFMMSTALFLARNEGLLDGQLAQEKGADCSGAERL